MNKAEKAVAQYELEREKAVLKELEQHYEYALNGINERLRMLQSAPETQSKVYQKQYQETLKKQVSAILERLHSDTYSSLDQYRHDAYTTGFVGTMYDLHSQDVPLLIPIDQEAVLKAVQHDTLLTSPLYDELGIDTKKMSRSISKELSRGLASGMTYDDIARNIKNTTKAPLARAKLIARTEGHRIHEQSSQDAAVAAKERGADLVKQWDATLDGDTRPNHRTLDGQIRELDEPYEVNGYTPMYPGDFGTAKEDCNCRCLSLKRARWALDEDELKQLRERAVRHSLYADDPKAFRAAKLPALKSFPEFQKSYLKAAAKATLKQDGAGARPPREYDGVFDDFEQLNPSDVERQSFASLRSATASSGYEYGVVIEKGAVRELQTSSLTDAIRIPLDDYGDGLTVLHSHTNATTFSAKDFTMLLNSKVEKVGVIGYNGDAYFTYIGSGWIPSLEEFEAEVGRIRQETNMAIMEDPDFFSWSLEERNYMAIREQAYRIARHFGWTIEGGRMDE